MGSYRGKKKARLERTAAQTKYIFCFLAGIIVLLLYAILNITRQQAERVKILIDKVISKGVDNDMFARHSTEIAMQIIERL
ncbi:MAG: hypothetical protein GY702_14240 [Desulfobulbaceae bacterium]|nr:hypothetical protein [Desulfobulbaceae bacterium]